jgi:hypothetical protein
MTVKFYPYQGRKYKNIELFIPLISFLHGKAAKLKKYLNIPQLLVHSLSSNQLPE